MCINESMLSQVQKDIHKYYCGKDASDEKTNKLVLNVMDKKKYVLHISALKFYLQHGLRLKKVHRKISFKQANFLKPFIEFNTEKRKNANNDFEKKCFKLMNNSVYGKTMENVRKHGDFEIVNTPERFQQLVNKPLFKHRHIINEDLVIVEKNKHTVELNKPIYMGMSILDYSKIHMYSFSYDVLKPKYRNQNIKIILNWLTNKHVALKLRLKFFDSVLSPTILFGLATLPLSKSQLQRFDVTQRKMLRTIVGWVAVDSTDWKTTMQRMNEKLDAALRLYPISLWSDAVFRKQFRLCARVCRHRERWPAAATFWNPPDNAEEYFTNQPFRKRGRPQVRWDDNLRKLGEMQFQQKTWSIPARHTSLWRSFENEYVQFCRETIALQTYGFDLFSFLVSRFLPVS